MAKSATKRAGHQAGKDKHVIAITGGRRFKETRSAPPSELGAATGELPIGKARFEAILKAAERSGLLGEKSGRIAGRVSARLVEQAKRQTGIEGDSDLITFALASLALDDDFAEAFRKSRGTVAADLKLGF